LPVSSQPAWLRVTTRCRPRLTPRSRGGVASKPESTLNQTDPPPDQPVEIPKLRTRNSKTFLNPDGTYSARIWPGTVHYQDAQGRWQEIDNRLVATSAAGYAFENAANRFKVRFAEPGQQNLVHFVRGDHWVTLTPVGPLRTVAPEVTDNRITYAGLLDGIDLEYQVVADGVKENIVLVAPSERHSFTFQMRHSDGVRLAQQPDGSIDFYAAASDDYLWSLAAPYMFDNPSVNSGQRSQTPEGYAPVQMELTERGQAGVYQITLTADPAWLADPARVYPVTIDPSVIIRPPSADTTLFSDAYANNNYGSSSQLVVGYSASGPWKARTLLQFDLSAVPPRSTILNASLGLIVLTQVNPTLTMRPCTR